MRLRPGVAVPASISQPGYDRAAQACGIVHFGIGAFHRAHQAAYTDAAMTAGDRNWGIIGVSLRSPAVAEAMNPQDGLFTLSEKSAAGSAVRLIGAVRKVLVTSQQRQQVIDAIASADTQILSFTITEKGYCRANDGSLDPALAGTDSVYAVLAEGLALRRSRQLPGVTLMSCDNLAGNGSQLSRLLESYLQVHDADLARWVAAHCTFPATMVDRIVPATTDADRDAVEAATGWRDEAAVVTEPFSQWIIEDKFAGARPRWEVAGAQFTADVTQFETAKLRMLNGAHSALAYLGLARGHGFVHRAIGDPEIAPLIERLMRIEAATSLTPAPDQNLDTYADALLERFANPALNHRLRQIAADGSQKIPQRWLETLRFHQSLGRQCPAILTALAAWIDFVGREGNDLDDPAATTLARLGKISDTSELIMALVGDAGMFSQNWVASAEDVTFLEAMIGRQP